MLKPISSPRHLAWFTYTRIALSALLAVIVLCRAAYQQGRVDAFAEKPARLEEPKAFRDLTICDGGHMRDQLDVQLVGDLAALRGVSISCVHTIDHRIVCSGSMTLGDASSDVHEVRGDLTVRGNLLVIDPATGVPVFKAVHP